MLQLKALENLLKSGIKVHPAAMVSFSALADVSRLRQRLMAMDRRFSDIEIEELALYGDVEQRLRQRKIRYRSSYPPQSIPPEQV